MLLWKSKVTLHPISLRYASVPKDWVEWHKDSFFTESIDMIIVCIVTNQGLPNKIKLDKAGLAMCFFFQINDGKEKGEIVWLYFGDVLFES